MMIPPMQPVLEDEAVLIRPLAETDRESLFAVASDREIWAIHPAHDRWQRPVFDPFFSEALASGGGLAIIDKATGQIFGSSRYDIRVARQDEVEIGWTYLARAYWGGAWNRRVKRLMLEHGLTRYGTVIFLVGEGNLRSRRAMEKIGGVLTERRQRWPMASGIEVDHVIYAITRESFAEGPLKRG